MIRRAVLATGVVLALAATLAPGGVAQTSDIPPEVTVQSKGRSVTATQGSYCWQAELLGLCSDSAYPLEVRCALPVKRGAKLTVTTAIAASSISARLVDAKGLVGSKLPAWKSGRDNVRGSAVWTFRLPRKARGAAAIDVFGRFPQGDLDVWAGVKTPTCSHSRFGKG